MHALPITKASLISIQVGLPGTYGSDDAADSHDHSWTTGIFKTPIDGSVFAGATGIRGDGQADLNHHGGVDKAVLAYSADHYPKWRAALSIPDMPFGAFGENLTIAGLSEESVCIGDIFQIGEVSFEVSQPRQPCWKLARRWRMHELPALVVQNGRSGWYFRVLKEGWIEKGTAVELVERKNPAWSVDRASNVLYYHRADPALTLELASVPGLSHSWVEELRERA